jgi:flavodoxin
MKKVLVLYYSQSGQLRDVLASIVAPLEESAEIDCDWRPVEPVEPYPYPWPFYTFFNAFPEAVTLDGCAVEEMELDEDYDLIVLGYTVWFLSPAIPVTGFLQSDQAKKLFKGKPVVTVSACRDMWLQAQEKMKGLLADLGARLLDNVVLIDQGESLYTFITTPRWLLTGRKDAFAGFPAAGIDPDEIRAASRFGERLAAALADNCELGEGPLLSKLNAVNVNGKLIASEKIAHRSFVAWSRLIKKAGRAGSRGRKVVISIYVVFLLFMILSVVPLNILLRKLIYPFRKEVIDRAVAGYELPSGK